VKDKWTSECWKKETGDIEVCAAHTAFNYLSITQWIGGLDSGREYAWETRHVEPRIKWIAARGIHKYHDLLCTEKDRVVAISDMLCCMEAAMRND
jgi:hypothetical protein